MKVERRNKVAPNIPKDLQSREPLWLGTQVWSPGKCELEFPDLLLWRSMVSGQLLNLF